jgi:transcriptional regulator with XRE-family HTH domain
MKISTYWSEGMSNQRLAAMLKAARVRLGLTQTKAARASGLLQTYISKIETGKAADVSFLNVLKLADAYQLRNLGSLYRTTNRDYKFLDRLVKANFKPWWGRNRTDFRSQ